MNPQLKIPMLGASLALGLWLSPISLYADEGHEHESPVAEEHEEQMDAEVGDHEHAMHEEVGGHEHEIEAGASGLEAEGHEHAMHEEAGGHGHDDMAAHGAMGDGGHMDMDGGFAQAKWCRETLLGGELMLDDKQTRRCMDLVSHHEGAGGGNVIVVHMTASADNTVNLFEPPRVMIRRGDTVRWVMDSGPFHNAVAYPNRIPFTVLPFEGPLLMKAGDSWSQTFFFPGTYEYHCHPHEALGMRGVVIVERESRLDEFRQVRAGEGVHAHH